MVLVVLVVMLFAVSCSGSQPVELAAGLWFDVDDYNDDRDYDDRLGLWFQYWNEGDVPAEPSGRWYSRAELPLGNVVFRLRVPPGFDVGCVRVAIAFARAEGDISADVVYVTRWTPASPESLRLSDWALSRNDYYVSASFSSSGETATIQLLGHSSPVESLRGRG